MKAAIAHDTLNPQGGAERVQAQVKGVYIQGGRHTNKRSRCRWAAKRLRCWPRILG